MHHYEVYSFKDIFISKNDVYFLKKEELAEFISKMQILAKSY